MASVMTPDRIETRGPDAPPPQRRSLPAALFAAIRPRQCVTKNLLVFFALIFAGRPQAGSDPVYLFDLAPLMAACTAYLLFGMTSASVGADGRLEIKVEGLVLVSTGQNPVATFRGIVSCQSIDAGAAVVRNVMTDPVPATTTGDAKIQATLDLPEPCFAPIVFVASGGGSWFSVTGV